MHSSYYGMSGMISGAAALFVSLTFEEFAFAYPTVFILGGLGILLGFGALIQTDETHPEASNLPTFVALTLSVVALYLAGLFF